MNSRRTFVKNTVIAGTGLALAPSFMSAGIQQNSTVQIGLIGVGLRGTNHLNNLLLRDDVSIRAICDIDENRIKICGDLIEKSGKNKPLFFDKDDLDYKNLLELKELDAVIIGGGSADHIS